MRTTIELPKDMYAKTEEMARQKGMTVQEMIVRVLEKELTLDEPRTGVRHTVEFPLIHSKHPGTLDLSQFNFDDLLA
jgi:hypothetical protein